MGRLATILDRRAELRNLARQHGANALAVFGSVARGEESPISDIDILVESGMEMDLLDLAELHGQLESTLGCRVDVLTVGALRGSARERILAEAILL